MNPTTDKDAVARAAAIPTELVDQAAGALPTGSASLNVTAAEVWVKWAADAFVFFAACRFLGGPAGGGHTARASEAKAAMPERPPRALGMVDLRLL